MNKNIDQFNVLRKIEKKPSITQRELAKDLGLSVGKINYCLRALNYKRLIKIQNFKKNPNKISYTYLLTPKGIAEKTKLTINFMKLKMREYDELQAELKENVK
jgi:EPS-associated MarR family transcriptional regulator